MKIIIAGAYAIGTHLAQLLARNNEDITLIDEDGERLAQIGRNFDLLTIEGNPGSIRTLRNAGAPDADLYIAVTPDEALNLNTCMVCHTLGARKTVAKIDNPELVEPDNEDFFRKLGVDSLIYPEMLAARDICSGLKMSWVRQRWDVHGGALVMLGIKVRECEIVNKPLKEISGPDDPYHVVAIKRGAETIIPGGNDMIKPFDLVYFMTTKNYIPYIRKIVGKENYVDVQNVMIMGGGETAVRTVKMMPKYMSAKIIEADADRCEVLNDVLDDNTMIIHGDGRDIPLLKEEGINNTQAFVAVTPSTETNILACLTAKRLGVRKTVAIVDNIDYVPMAQSLDIGTIVNKKAIAASAIYQLMLGENVANIKFLTTTNADVAEFIPAEGSKVTRRQVKDLGLPVGVTIGGLVRDDEGILVSGNTQIKAGDSVMVFCNNVDMKKIEKYFK